jgi:hypothetical protein
MPTDSATSSQRDTATDASPEKNATDSNGSESPQIQRHPWSELAQEFAETWGRADPSNPQPEHAEVLGINGSGKTLWMCKAVQERMIVRHTPTVICQSKPADDTVMRLGWPIITDGNTQRVRRERWSVYWPQTNATGRARKAYQADKFRDLLNSLWRPQSNTIVVLDDVGYIQGLYCSDGEPLNPIIEMYLREGRSSGITVVMLKQRPQGARREMHSETQWTIAFAPKDEDDKERFAQLYGAKKVWMPVFDSMDSDKHEFLIKHHRTQAAFISWVDTPLKPLKRPERDAKARG